MTTPLGQWLRGTVLIAGLLSHAELVGADGTPTTRPPLPPAARPPLPKTAVEQFRELLAASPEQREDYLGRKKPASAELIRASLREFDRLTPNERELRLRVLQLHQNLVPLLQSSAEERARLLADVPQEDRPLLEDRVAAWDSLPDSARQVLLGDKASLNRFIQLLRTPGTNRQDLLVQLPEGDRTAVEAQFARWQALPEEVQARATKEFEKFFELTPAEREKTLGRLSDTERRQMAQALRGYEALAPEQRDRCVRSFKKFSGMTEAERAEFLRSASHWRVMAPDERAAWRRLVNVLGTPAPIPPVPPTAERRRAEMVATNPPSIHLPQ